MQFLVSVPCFDDLNIVDGIKVVVPSFSSSISFSAWQTAEVPHKAELEKVWPKVSLIPFDTFLGCA
jgi:hypothetical protein